MVAGEQALGETGQAVSGQIQIEHKWKSVKQAFRDRGQSVVPQVAAQPKMQYTRKPGQRMNARARAREREREKKKRKGRLTAL